MVAALEYRLRGLDDFTKGDHICGFYENDEQRQRSMARFVKGGLQAREKIVYIADHTAAASVIKGLHEHGAHVDDAIQSHQLEVFSQSDAYTRDGVFDPDKMILQLRQAEQGALGDGFTGLRVTGEMTWALRGLPGSDRLLEYEAKLNQFFPSSNSLAICQYDLRRFTPDLLQRILLSHPTVSIGDELFDNPYFVPPAQLDPGDWAKTAFDQWLNALRRRKRLEQELAEQAAEWQAFSYRVSHDLRTPIWAMNGLADMVLKSETTLTTEGRQSLQEIQDAAQRALDTVKAILRLAQEEGPSLQRETVDVSRTANEILDKLRRTDPSRQVHVDVQPQMQLSADPILFRVALENVLSNAWKYSRDAEPAEIRVFAKAVDSDFVLAVQDNGIGFSPSEAPRLFQPFQRLPDAAGFDGSGIGLSTVRRVMQRHGGTAWAESEKGRGATFFLRFPQGATASVAR